MNKTEWKEALNELLESARKSACEDDQDQMINDFERDEEERLEVFTGDQNVGHKEELLEHAQRYQGNWKYEHNSSMSPIF